MGLDMLPKIFPVECRLAVFPSARRRAGVEAMRLFVTNQQVSVRQPRSVGKKSEEPSMVLMQAQSMAAEYTVPKPPPLPVRKDRCWVWPHII